MSTKTLTSSKNKNINKYIFSALCILLIYPPFFRGLFFQRELLPTQIITSIVFLIYFAYNRKSQSVKETSYVELGVLAIVFLYIISTLFAVNINLSIEETLKYMDYLLILFLAKRLITDVDRSKTVLTTLVLTGVVVVFIGTGSALETFNYNGAFVGGMMNSTLQYHNTFGTYSLAILFLAYMLAGSYSNKSKYLMSASSFILFFGFIMSYSRGAWILLPLVGFIYYMFISIEQKKTFIANFIGNLIALILILNKFTSTIESTNKSTGWIWVLVGVATSLIITILVEKALEKLKLSNKVYNIIIPAMVILLPIVAIGFKGAFLGLLPQNLAQRIGSISLETETVTERGVFYRDAAKIIKDYPLIGTGGGGWQTLYKMYQSYAYWTTQAHNYFMQLWIEIGTIGISLFILTTIMYVLNAFFTYRKTDNLNTKDFTVAIFATVITILIHSVIDFDLSLSSIAIIMWGLIGTQLGISSFKMKMKLELGPKTSYVTAFLAIVLLILSSTSYMASNAAEKGVALVQSKQIEEGTKKFGLASTLNPFNPNYLADYANLSNSIAKKNEDNEAIKEAQNNMDKAISLSEYDSKLVSSAIGFYISNGDIDKSLELIRKLEKYNPLNSGTYETKSNLLLSIADYNLKQGNTEQGIKLLKDIVAIENRIEELNEDITNSVEVITRKVLFVELTNETKERIENAKEILDIINN